MHECNAKLAEKKQREESTKTERGERGGVGLRDGGRGEMEEGGGQWGGGSGVLLAVSVTEFSLLSLSLSFFFFFFLVAVAAF